MIARITAGVTLLLLLNACGMNEKTDVMFVCASPSGEKIATFYRVAHGDNPINHEMKINIRKSGNAFDESMASFSFKYGYDAIIRWQSEHALDIEYPTDSERLHQETVVFGTSQTFSSSDTIQINYQQRASMHGYFLVEQRCFNRVNE